MVLIPVLIGIPVILAVLMALLKDGRIRGIIVYAGAGCIMAATLALLAAGEAADTGAQYFYGDGDGGPSDDGWGDRLMLLIVFMSVKYSQGAACGFVGGADRLILYVEQTARSWKRST